MARLHLSPEVMLRLVSGPSPAAETFGALYHLSHCRPCRKRLVESFPEAGSALLERYALEEPSRPPLEELAREVGLEGGWLAGDLRGLEAELLEVAGEYFEEIAAAPGLWLELAPLSETERSRALERPRFQRLGLAHYLLSLARQEWHSDPRRAQHLSELALEVTGCAHSADYVAGVREGLQVRAKAYRGNSLRLQGDLRRAQAEISQAAISLESENSAVVLTADVLRLQAALARDQRDFDSALLAAERAKEIYVEESRPRMAFWMGVVHAAILGEQAKAEEAITELTTLLESAPEQLQHTEPWWIAQQHLCTTMVETRRLWEARQKLLELKHQALFQRRPLMKARLGWIEALLNGAEGNFRAAQAHLEEVQEVFVSRGMPYDAALVCLDLAEIYLREGQPHEARSLASTLEFLFRSRGIEREALASVKVVVEALKKETATATNLQACRQSLHVYRRRGGEPS